MNYTSLYDSTYFDGLSAMTFKQIEMKLVKNYRNNNINDLQH